MRDSWVLGFWVEGTELEFVFVAGKTFRAVSEQKASRECNAVLFDWMQNVCCIHTLVVRDAKFKRQKIQDLR